MRVFHLCVLAASLFAAVSLKAQNSLSAGKHWYQGNTHTHTLNSDGDATPEDVTQWYKGHGYSFLVITDHERVTDARPLNLRFAEPGKFLVLQGEEVTQRVIDSSVPDKRRQAHVVAIGINAAIAPLGDKGLAPDGTTMVATYDRNISEILKARGIAQINHPNYRWSVRANDLAHVPDSTLYEVWNGHPWVNNLGGRDELGHISPSTETLWDDLLSRGILLFGVADDDAHHYKPEELQDPLATHPGRAWIMVRADTLAERSILGAIRRGDFYASTGVTLEDYSASPSRIEIRIAKPARPDDLRRYTTRFTGKHGKLLAEAYGRNPSYTIRGNEGYVRATIVDSNGGKAWTQPVFTRKSPLR